MGGIRVFIRVSFLASLLLALLLNKSTQFYTAVYYLPGLLQNIFWAFHSIIISISFLSQLHAQTTGNRLYSLYDRVLSHLLTYWNHALFYFLDEWDLAD